MTDLNFGPFGWLIHYSQKEDKSKDRNLWRIVLKETEPVGWRVAYLVLRDRKIRRLERHPGSFETFEPVRGKAILYVCPGEDFDSLQAFHLDRPVILKKNLWHGLVALTTEAEIKICENLRVECRYRSLGFWLDYRQKKLHLRHKTILC